MCMSPPHLNVSALGYFFHNFLDYWVVRTAQIQQLKGDRHNLDGQINMKNTLNKAKTIRADLLDLYLDFEDYFVKFKFW